jgi:hypothetical protein
MRHPCRQQLGVVRADQRRFDLEHRQVIDAARAASFAAVEPFRVHQLEVTRHARDVGVEGDDRIDRRNAGTG